MNYAAINAKLKAMRARLLTPQDYEDISQMETAAEVMEWLKSTGIKTEVSTDLNASIERTLRHAVISAANSICLYIPDKAQRSYITAMASTADPANSVNPAGDNHQSRFHYYIAQWKQLARLDKANRTALRSILGAEIDLNNILWMYRLKRYHRIKGDSTYGYLVPIRYKLSKPMTQRMADSETPKALLEEIAQCPYATTIVFTHTKAEWGSPSHFTPEQQLSQAIDRCYQAAARRYPNTLAPALAYLHRKKLEEQRIIAAVTPKL